jgi:hypothetical protein
MEETSMKQVTNNDSDCYLLHVNSLFALLFIPEDGGDMLLRNIG